MEFCPPVLLVYEDVALFLRDWRRRRRGVLNRQRLGINGIDSLANVDLDPSPKENIMAQPHRVIGRRVRNMASVSHLIS